jgi:sulfhydrogenase subunit alpha
MKNIEVPALARVEGEGALYIRLKNGSIAEVELNIYEPPRFFEGFFRTGIFKKFPISLPAFAGSAQSLTK